METPGQSLCDAMRFSFGTLVNDVVDGGLFHGPFPGFPIVAGQGEAVPVGVIQLRMIGPVVISRPPRFCPEHRVMRYRLRGQDPVVQLPRPLKLVEVLGPRLPRSSFNMPSNSSPRVSMGSLVT